MTTTPDYAGLLPCPHCGGIAAKHHRPQAGAVRIVCSECAAQTAWFSEAHGGNPDFAWNRRAPSDADNYIDQLNTLCEDFGCEPGADRLHWLHDRLSALRTLLESNAALERERDQLWEETARLSEQRVRVWQERAEAAEAERDRLAERVAELEGASDRIMPYLRWTISEESPGYHPTLPSAVAAFKEARTARSLVKGGVDG